MQAVILAGGRGKRLEKLTNKIPKPLIKIGDKPVLEHQILMFKKYGIKDIFILSGYLGQLIEKYLTNNKKWELKINHLIEKTPLGTAGAIKTLQAQITNDFLVISGDIMFDIDIERFIKFHQKHNGSTATIIVHPNDHPYDSDLVDIDRDKVRSFLIRPHPANLLYRNLTNASILILSPKIFKYIPIEEKLDLEKDIFPKILSEGGKIYAYKTPEYIKDMGTPKRLAQVRADFISGKITRLNKKNRRPAIFLDRDGVINNKSNEHVTKLADFKLYPFTANAIKKINKSDYLTIIITNQPAIAKGMMTFDQLDMIHKKLETELGSKGAKIDAIYFCPHHPEKGFAGEIPKLKINCNCRKPKIGLIKKAVRDFNIDLPKSFFIGDSTTDFKTAKNAKIRFLGVNTGHAFKDQKYPIEKNFKIYKNLLEAVKSIL